MSKFLAWNLVDNFTAREVSLLATGVDPDGTTNKSTPLFNRMLNSFEKAIPWYEKIIRHTAEGEEEYCADMLLNVEMIEEISYSRQGYQVDFGDSPKHSSFENQRFSREEVGRWLGAIGVSSLYPFVQKGLSQSTHSNKFVADPPMGKRERDTLLTIIFVLCKEAKIDHTRPAKAAGFIQATAIDLGVSLPETTVEGYLKKIPDALATRMK